MRTVFIDTSGVQAYLNKNDEHHQSAQRILKEFNGTGSVKLVATDYILVEIGNAFSKVGKHISAIAFIDAFRRSPTCSVVRINEAQFEKSTRHNLKRHLTSIASMAIKNGG